MSYTLQDYRDYVRGHLDVDAEDIDDALVDKWCREATRDIVESRDRWEFLEYRWTLELAPDVASYDLAALITDPPVDRVTSVKPADRGRLSWIGIDEAEERFPTSQPSTPSFYTVYGTELVVYPTPSATETVALRGYRKVRDWVAGGSGASSDLPEEFVEVIRNRILGEAYAQQEDPDLGQLYFSKAAALLKRVAARDGTPAHQPLIMGDRRTVANLGRIPFSFEV